MKKQMILVFGLLICGMVQCQENQSRKNRIMKFMCSVNQYHSDFTLNLDDVGMTLLENERYESDSNGNLWLRRKTIERRLGQPLVSDNGPKKFIARFVTTLDKSFTGDTGFTRCEQLSLEAIDEKNKPADNEKIALSRCFYNLDVIGNGLRNAIKALDKLNGYELCEKTGSYTKKASK